MNIKPFGVFAAVTLASISFAVAAPKAYQVTGPVLEVNESSIVVQKGNERWEIARDAKTLRGRRPSLRALISVQLAPPAAATTEQASEYTSHDLSAKLAANAAGCAFHNRRGEAVVAAAARADRRLKHLAED